MSFLLWLQRHFLDKSEDGEEEGFQESEQSSFSWNQNMRIVLALFIVLLSSAVMWWILA